MKRLLPLHRTGTRLIALGLLASCAPAFAADESRRECPASMNRHSVFNCEFVLSNPNFDERPRNAVSGDPVWHDVPGWQVSAPVQIHALWHGSRYLGIAVGVEPGARMSQTIRVTRLDQGSGVPVPTYHVVFEASSFGRVTDSPLTARLVGIDSHGAETELARVDVSPNDDDLEEFNFNGRPRGDNPASVRVEFVRNGGTRPIYIGGVGITQTFDR
ncbi:MAG: hypothetical protein WBW32_14475 [Luteibacter sp.]